MHEPNPFKMLAQLPDPVTTYWLAFNKLQDPRQREESYWQMLKETDPDRYHKELMAEAAAYREASMAKANRTE